MKRSFENFFTVTNPLFWVLWLILKIFILLKGIWDWTTIGDWIYLHNKINKLTNKELERLIELRKLKPKISIKLIIYFHKRYLWNYGSKKAIEILRERNRAGYRYDLENVFAEKPTKIYFNKE